MHQLKEEVFLFEGIRFHFIPTGKFKTVNFIWKSKTVLDAKTITKRALLPYVLEKGTDNFPTEKALMQRLDELYGAVLSIDGSKKGNHHILTYHLEVANEKYVPNETTLISEALSLFHEIIFRPYREEGIFPEKRVSREKQTLQNKINAIRDDKMAYANQRLIDEMCETERYHLHTNGYQEDLDAITATDLSAYYDTMLQDDEMDVYLVGDIDIAEMKAQIRQAFAAVPCAGKTAEVVQDDTPADTKVKEIIEHEQIQQAKLHIGYRTHIRYADEEYAALHVVNGLFGGFPSSKLFVNVREKESLAYYAVSRLESHKGLMFAFSGIDGADFSKTYDIIEVQRRALEQGDFTEEALEQVKTLIESEWKETLDHAQGIAELFYQQVIGGKTREPESFMEEIRQVTKEDVMEAAKQIELDTVYLLTNEKEADLDGKTNV